MTFQPALTCSNPELGVPQTQMNGLNYTADLHSLQSLNASVWDAVLISTNTAGAAVPESGQHGNWSNIARCVSRPNNSRVDLACHVSSTVRQRRLPRTKLERSRCLWLQSRPALVVISVSMLLLWSQFYRHARNLCQANALTIEKALVGCSIRHPQESVSWAGERTEGSCRQLRFT